MLLELLDKSFRNRGSLLYFFPIVSVIFINIFKSFSLCMSKFFKIKKEALEALNLFKIIGFYLLVNY